MPADISVIDKSFRFWEKLCSTHRRKENAEQISIHIGRSLSRSRLFETRIIKFQFFDGDANRAPEDRLPRQAARGPLVSGGMAICRKGRTRAGLRRDQARYH